MSLDACYLTYLTAELDDKLKGSRVEKVFMPSRDEVVFVMRGMQKHRLLINASTNAPRVCITTDDPENPKVPPTFCMVMRKHFNGAKLLRAYMPEFERVIRFEFECKNDFFETVYKTVVVELMGRSANMIVVDQNDKIIDAIRRIDLSANSGRCILPQALYIPPQKQTDKTDIILADSVEDIYKNPEITFESAIMNSFCGISPIIARELAYKASGKSEMRVRQLGTGDGERLYALINDIKENIKNKTCAPTLIKQKDNGKFVDFCFMPVTQYGDFCECVSFGSPSEAVDTFYSASGKKTRLEQKTKDLSQFITRLMARISKTMSVRKKELEASKNAEKYRVYGELINANLYKMQSGMTKLVTENYYDDCKEITIPLRADRSPSANAQIYFKKYTKAKNSAAILTELIAKDQKELDYLESVFYALCDCESVADANGIRNELVNGGFLRTGKRIKNSEAPTMPREFEKDGFKILVGKNNIQNDLITVKLSRKNDIWLHTKNIHSSHVLICCGSNEAPNSVIEYAARLCAYYSKAKNDLKVEVDYCPVQNVKKPVGARPGMVVYNGYNTVVVKPMESENL